MSTPASNWQSRAPFELRELDYLYSGLSGEERDELLQCLLIAATEGEGAMTGVLEGTMLFEAVKELTNGVGEAMA